VPGRNGARRADDDDPLTSTAFSRDAMAATDARSYRSARHSQVPDDRYADALNEQTQTFSMNSMYPPEPQQATGGYPARGQQPPQPGQPQQRPQMPPAGGSRSASDRDASYPYPEQRQPARPTQAQAPADQHEDPYGRPAPGRPAANGYGEPRRGNGRH
jgi:hypothetical protein